LLEKRTRDLNPDFSHCIPEPGKSGRKGEYGPDFRD
jgi:hypothetical protein